MSSDESTDADARWSRRGFLTAGTAVGLGAIGIGATAAQNDAQSTSRSFTVRIENVSDGSTLDTTDGTKPIPLSPGAYAVHTRDEPMFSSGHPERDNGLEEIAEDGMPGRLAESLQARDTVLESGAFTTPVGADGPAPIGPGDAYEFTVAAESGRPTQYLSLVTMFIQSNDLFYSLGGASGMALFTGDGNAPVAGDVTDRVGLWDAGTEVNEEPGVGGDQAPRQRGANVGLVERGTVAPIADVNGYDYPATEDVVRVRVTPNGSE
ncbi:spondin domain-containing protein [Haloarcula sp. 1CSR25-25]|uniref:spondin domain-containing protein n=1 Tax=Haloarcula sp. 1CSR25-25 TaxID=2862545 RepID=UPI0028950027|nr:spondin domain-containing protein [Haloarcula sp. 1CSR25-25]MDT3434497.1 spondin domain-containing protein [Haloarcula sp. 1CSR25-25]